MGLPAGSGPSEQNQMTQNSPLLAVPGVVAATFPSALVKGHFDVKSPPASLPLKDGLHHQGHLQYLAALLGAAPVKHQHLIPVKVLPSLADIPIFSDIFGERYINKALYFSTHQPMRLHDLLQLAFLQGDCFKSV